MKKKEAEIENLEDKKRYSMFLTSEFSNRLDELKNEKGFKSETIKIEAGEKNFTWPQN